MCALCTEEIVVSSMNTGLCIYALTVIDDELFALLCRYDKDHVAVYSTSDHQLLRYLDVPGYRHYDSNDITSCVRRKCLYMSDFSNKSIHRYALASNDTIKWPLSFEPTCLSVTPNGNVLVTYQCPPKLVELSAESGEQVREISLQDGIVFLKHGIQLANGKFVVCHGDLRGCLHQVCMVDDDGRVTHSYGGKDGYDDGELNFPRHLAVDEDAKLIFVADWGNHRLVVLSRTLEFVRYIRNSQPYRLCLDQKTRRLYVGNTERGVIIIQL